MDPCGRALIDKSGLDRGAVRDTVWTYCQKAGRCLAQRFAEASPALERICINTNLWSPFLSQAWRVIRSREGLSLQEIPQKGALHIFEARFGTM